MCSGEDMKCVVRKFEENMNVFYASLRETWNVFYIRHAMRYKMCSTHKCVLHTSRGEICCV